MVKYADSDSTRDPCVMKKKQGRERRTTTARVTSITRQIKEVTINVRLTVVWSLWLTATHKATINSARGGYLLDQAGQVPPSNNC